MMKLAGRAKLEARLTVDVARARRVDRIGRAEGLQGPDSSFLANSLPKSGTHLLLKALSMMPQVRRIRLQVAPKLSKHFAAAEGEEAVLVGISRLVPLSRSRLEAALRRLPPGAFASAHVPYTRELADLLQELGMKMVVMIRDPRDVVVSSARYLPQRGRHPLRDLFSVQDAHGRIFTSIVGTPAAGPGGPQMLNIRDRVRSVVTWGTLPSVHITRFEDLVGREGGGSAAAQQAALRAIAGHVGAPCDEVQLERIGRSLFGGTGTFRQGQIGAWRSAFDKDHLTAAKPLLDDLLIELGYEESTAWSD